jgi:hypothetical protein
MNPGVHSRRARRSHVLTGALVLLAPLVLAGCSEQGSASQIDSPVTVTMRNATVLLENRAEQPLDNVTLTVTPYGKNGAFTKALSRLERAERREVALADLSTADGTKFNPMLIRPRQVRVTATDTAGKQYEVELPWK